MSKKSGFIGASETTFEILEGIRELNGAGVTELGEYLDLPKSSVHNYLSTLEEANYLVKRNDKYCVGMQFIKLGNHARNRHPVYPTAVPEANRVANETGEWVNLMAGEHGVGVYLYRCSGERAIKDDVQIGDQAYLHSTALGQSILAHSPTEYVEKVIDEHGLPPVTERTVTDRDELRELLKDVRERGYAIDNEERLKGLRCVAAPILGKNGEAIAAISVSGPINRMRRERIDETISSVVLEAANVIELNVTHA